ncbi:DUF5462 family protein [Chromobacterium haemolyticum]|uniref:Uncharacterized protein n=3 Tax=Chromobacterium haemolyticum TaxID=394935 RepID=A0A1W0CA98_9NEIS|nr:hypothetical protein B0T45_22670 [Chromobacterium haemolyticum]
MSPLKVFAAEVKWESIQSLGVVNGKAKQGSMVEIVRSLPNPILFQIPHGTATQMPTQLVIPETISVLSDEVTLEVKGEFPLLTKGTAASHGQYVFRVGLWVDGIRIAPIFASGGEQTRIQVPAGAKTIQLRTVEPGRLLVPASSRGEVRLPLVVEGWSDRF